MAGSASVQEEPKMKSDLLFGHISAYSSTIHKVVLSLKSIPWSSFQLLVCRSFLLVSKKVIVTATWSRNTLCSVEKTFTQTGNVCVQHQSPTLKVSLVHLKWFCWYDLGRTISQYHIQLFQFEMTEMFKDHKTLFRTVLTFILSLKGPNYYICALCLRIRAKALHLIL